MVSPFIQTHSLLERHFLVEQHSPLVLPSRVVWLTLIHNMVCLDSDLFHQLTSVG